MKPLEIPKMHCKSQISILSQLKGVVAMSIHWLLGATNGNQGQTMMNFKVLLSHIKLQGSHFFGLTKFHDISRFFSKFPGIFFIIFKV